MVVAAMFNYLVTKVIGRAFCDLCGVITAFNRVPQIKRVAAAIMHLFHSIFTSYGFHSVCWRCYFNLEYLFLSSRGRWAIVRVLSELSLSLTMCPLWRDGFDCSNKGLRSFTRDRYFSMFSVMMALNNGPLEVL
ncbi:hypothetical protein CDAR_87581 [Caerostris darwini]|uniref:Uncharacterized protein n=1 Tax=Caerostris darwini TaxID=1538125 RepID=A0AAV4WZF0_9ARAC|nr:hypothetical protein CDAR_87581 [Caerostris darwini]